MVDAPAPRLAFWLERPHLPACEIAALSGYGMVLVDMEHGAIGAEALDGLVAACKGLGLLTYVRVAAADRVAVQQALDFGADGVVVPMIRDAAHAAEAAAFAKYPPLGSRGAGYSRAMRYGFAAVDHYEAANRATACHLMIETPGALRDVAAICALPTVDGVFIGPADLSLTRGRGPFRFGPGDEEDFRAVAAAARAAGKALGLPAPGAGAFAFAAAAGADYVTIADDLSAMKQGFEAAMAAARTRLA